jgi:carbamoyltransferase
VALGAALAAYHQLGVGWSEPLTHVAFGPEYGEEDIRKELLASGLPFRKSADIARDTAGYLAESKIVGWFQGRMEAGARALGKRSILANPCDPLASDIVNQKVKFRESWRPFCPSALSGEASQHFACEGPLPYMIVACEARPGVKARLPSVVHVDNTVRVQTVTRDHDPRFHRLLEAFRQLSGYGVVLNTSFNVKGEPIVCSPRDAINCFLSTGIDILVLGDFICEKVPSLLQTERQASGAG